MVSREWSEHRTCPVCFEAFGESRVEASTSAADLDGAAEEGSRLLGEPERRRLVLKCGHSVCEAVSEGVDGAESDVSDLPTKHRQ